MNKTAQNKKIESHLARGYRITAAQAYTKYGCLRLAARINDLRNMGCKIVTNMVNKNGKRFAEYKQA